MLPTDDSYPLSPLQEGMLFEHLHLRRPGVDVEQVICRMRNAPDERAFQAAWQRVADRHPTLRTRFCWDGPGKPSQEVVATLVFPFENHDWSRLGRKDWEKKWGDFLLADRVRGFVLDEAPLTRLAVMREPRGGARMCWTFHHLLLDARGIVVMLKEVFVIYEAIKSGVAAGLEPVVPFRRFIDWHAARDWSCSKDFWSKAISGFCGTSSLPAGRPETTTDEDSRGEREIVFSPRITRRLKAWAEQTGVTLNTIVQGCWALLLSRYSGEQDVVFGAIRAGRRGSCDGAESIVGLCINNVPVRVKVPPESLLIPWLRELRDFWVAIREHEHVPLVTVMGWSGTPHGTAMFDTFVNFQDPSWDVALAEQGGEWRRREFSIVSQPGYPLTVDAYGSPSLRIRIYYDRRRYCEADVERMLGHWRTLIEAIAANPERMLRDLPILTKAERRQSVVEWNRTATKYPRNRTIHHLFEEQVMRTPQAVAAVYADEQITYEKLNFRANRIANFLRSLDIGRGALVGICMERSIDLVAGLLGILKAGGAYVPLDPEYPNERLAFMLRDTAAPVLLTQERLLDQLPETTAKVICLDRDWKLVRQHSSDSVKSDVTADDLAYVIYTSGSTGVPKGVCVPHKAVVRLVRNANYISIQPDDRVAQAANASFDAATFEVWGALLNGARVVGISKVDLLSPAKLAGQIRDLGITTLFLTTALFNQLAREIPNAFASLRHLLFGGEAVDPPCVRAVLQGRPPNRLLHVYGPTETTTFATWLHVTEVADGAATVPIGRPISNTEAYVLDPAGNLVPVGAPGVLFLGGDVVAAVYLHQPKLT
ncbi:MAG: AMP-binding protein, partial [Verrucomicrobiaceae bacterium]